MKQKCNITLYMYMYMCLSEKKMKESTYVKKNLHVRYISRFYEIKMLHIHCTCIGVYERKMKKILALIINSTSS